jgi:hypothetical protein
MTKTKPHLLHQHHNKVLFATVLPVSELPTVLRLQITDLIKMLDRRFDQDEPHLLHQHRRKCSCQSCCLSLSCRLGYGCTSSTLTQGLTKL